LDLLFKCPSICAGQRVYKKLYGFMYREEKEVGVMEQKRGKEAETENKVDKPFSNYIFSKRGPRDIM
jgi:hypothetical protein